MDPTLFNKEWLEADGLGGFAMGTAAGIRTRRYHALLQVATTPPTGRMVLVNGFDAWIETQEGNFSLSSQQYAPDVIHPEGVNHIESFESDPWPKWIYRLPNGIRVQQEIFVPKGSPSVVIAWKLLSKKKATLHVRPFFSGRDYHSTHHANESFQFNPVQKRDDRIIWQPYPGVPPVAAVSNGTYVHKPDWYRDFLYQEERARGLDAVEDLASPGEFQWEMSGKEAVLIFTAEGIAGDPLPVSHSPLTLLSTLRKSEGDRRQKFSSRLHRSADDYLVQRGTGKTIIAGYPWFTDWGRDTFIAIRGMCISAGRLDEAGQILLEWAGAVSEGMLPNLFTDSGVAPEYNAIDASLWYIIAIHDFLRAAQSLGHPVSDKDQDRLKMAVEAILTGYRKGTRFQIHMDTDGLIAGGESGIALTWMDARVNGHPITPRIGKPVEIQALWLNALKIGSQLNPSSSWQELFMRGLGSFEKKFWNEEKECLNDVIDVDHKPGLIDASFRPNQILAIGGLPYPLLEGERAKRIVDQIEDKLWTPLGLRTLAPGESGYAPRYEGDSFARDSVYHQGTVWPWLLGPFVEAWINVRRKTPKVIREAREKFLSPVLQHMNEAGLGHISEISDAESPFTPRGCPFQAWSVGEVLRLQETILSPVPGKEIRDEKHRRTPALRR